MQNKETYKPLVSFVIPTHNRGSVLKNCLDSVINQTYSNIEVIVINDNSIDNTEDILREYSHKYSCLKYYKNDGNGGNAARNMGIQEASGDYIAFMDDDDICEPFRIEEQMRPVLSSNYFYDFIISSLTFFSNGREVEVIDYLKPMDSIGFTVRWLIKKDLLLKVGCFDANQPSLQDVELFWRLREVANIYHSTKSVVRAMSSPVSITKNKTKMINGIKRLLELHKNKMSSLEINIWLITLCKNFSKIGDWDSYWNYFKQIDKRRSPISSLYLIASYILHSNGLLALHSKIYSRYHRVKAKSFFTHKVFK